MDLLEKVEKLEKENEDLKSRVIDLTFDQNYSKEKELVEFVRELYSSLKDKKSFVKLSKNDIVNNLRDYIENFAKDNKLQL
ncbi:MAG: hypothetical protein ACOC1K_07225 [Nanoarchaeota archaeon]